MEARYDAAASWPNNLQPITRTADRNEASKQMEMSHCCRHFDNDVNVEDSDGICSNKWFMLVHLIEKGEKVFFRPAGCTNHHSPKKLFKNKSLELLNNKTNCSQQNANHFPCTKYGFTNHLLFASSFNVWFVLRFEVRLHLFGCYMIDFECMVLSKRLIFVYCVYSFRFSLHFCLLVSQFSVFYVNSICLLMIRFHWLLSEQPLDFWRPQNLFDWREEK